MAKSIYLELRKKCRPKQSYTNMSNPTTEERVPMAQWTRRLPTEQEIPGSSPGRDLFYVFVGFA